MGLPEPEFIGGEVDLRINIYRKQIDDTTFFQHNTSDTETAGKPPENRRKAADKLPITEQERKIHKYVIENGSISTAQTAKLLGVKQRRAREILGKMVENCWLRKEGASRSTIYVINTGVGEL